MGVGNGVGPPSAVGEDLAIEIGGEGGSLLSQACAIKPRPNSPPATVILRRNFFSIVGHDIIRMSTIQYF